MFWNRCELQISNFKGEHGEDLELIAELISRVKIMTRKSRQEYPQLRNKRGIVNEQRWSLKGILATGAYTDSFCVSIIE